MIAKLTLSAGKLAKAAQEYIERQGWKVTTGQIVVKRGCDGDPRESWTPDTAGYEATVTPKPAQPAYQSGPPDALVNDQ